MNDGSGWMSVCEVFGALPNQEAVKLSNMTNLREFENLNVTEMIENLLSY